MTSLVGPVPRPSPNKNPIRSSVVLPSRPSSGYAGLDARQAEVVDRIVIYNDELAKGPDGQWRFTKRTVAGDA